MKSRQAYSRIEEASADSVKGPRRDEQRESISEGDVEDGCGTGQGVVGGVCGLRCDGLVPRKGEPEEEDGADKLSRCSYEVCLDGARSLMSRLTVRGIRTGSLSASSRAGAGATAVGGLLLPHGVAQRVCARSISRMGAHREGVYEGEEAGGWRGGVGGGGS